MRPRRGSGGGVPRQQVRWPPVCLSPGPATHNGTPIGTTWSLARLQTVEFLDRYHPGHDAGRSQTFAGYTILGPLGAGGMGEVYLTAHPQLPRRDALKVLPAALSGDVEYRARFEREAYSGFTGSPAYSVSAYSAL